MRNEANRVSLGAVHTHTHTHTSTFRKIKRVANEATLFGVKNRLCVVLYLGKNVVLEIACFSCCLKILSEKEFLLQRDYANYTEFLCNYHCLEILVMCFLSSKKINFIAELTNLNLLNELEEQGGVA
ncbi:MAG TPA: hypothetical protein OIM48_00980 [Clostridiaceae bacterium]|nr:hypothetical protein [Clostridiaceae bacterium]